MALPKWSLRSAPLTLIVCGLASLAGELAGVFATALAGVGRIQPELLLAWLIFLKALAELLAEGGDGARGRVLDICTKRHHEGGVADMLDLDRVGAMIHYRKIRPGLRPRLNGR